MQDEDAHFARFYVSFVVTREERRRERRKAKRARYKKNKKLKRWLIALLQVKNTARLSISCPSDGVDYTEAVHAFFFSQRCESMSSQPDNFYYTEALRWIQEEEKNFICR